MTAERRKSARKIPPETSAGTPPTSNNFDADLLPKRLYAADRYPPEGRINSYSKPEYLLDLVEALEGTNEFNYIRSSSLGSLFDLPVRKASISGKLVHQLLCRSLATERKYELWFVFAGQPFRFSLREFGLLTGLPCGSYPSAQTIQSRQTPSDPKEPYWNTLISKSQKIVSIKEIVGWLKRDKRRPDGQKMPAWRRLRLALIVIVEGILICNSQPVRASMQVVEMVKDVESFLEYPWGRESFLLTLRMVKLSKRCHSFEELISKLNQSHTATHGFTLAYQLLIFKAIPAFEIYLPDSNDEQTFTDQSIIQLTKLKTFHNSNIMETENIPNLHINPILLSEDTTYDGVNTWPDEVGDLPLSYMERLVSCGFKFQKGMWQGGVDTWPIMVPQTKPAATSRNNTKVHNRSQPTGGGNAKMPEPKKSRPTCVKGKEYNLIDPEAIMDLVDQKNAAHLDEIKKLWAIEKSLMKDELFDEIISELRHGGKFPSDVPSGNRKNPPKNKEQAGLFAGVSQVLNDLNQESTSDDFIDTRDRNVAGFTNPIPVVSPVDNQAPIPPSSTDVQDVEKTKAACPEKSPSTAPERTSAMASDINPVMDAVSDPLKSKNIDSGPCNPFDDFLNDGVEDGTSGEEHSYPEDSAADSDPELAHHSENIEGPANIHQDIEAPRTNSELIADQINHAADIQANIGGLSNTDTREEVFSGVEPPAGDAEGSEEVGDNSETEDDEAEQTDDNEAEDDGDNEAEDDVNDDEQEAIDGDQEIKRGLKRNHPNESTPMGVHDPKTPCFNPLKRLRKKPRRFRDSTAKKELAGGINYWQHPEERLAPFLKVNATLKKKFLTTLHQYKPKEFIVDGHSVRKPFFKEIYTNQSMVDSHHMEAMLSLVWRKFGQTFLENRIAIMDTWFTRQLVSEFPKFKKSKMSKGWPWNSTVRNTVRGIVPNRHNKLEWYSDVDKLYAPMFLPRSHWVAILIDLKEGKISIFDTLMSKTDEKKLRKWMQPIVEILPAVIRDLVTPALLVDVVPSSFEYARAADVSQNERTGDCGPLTVKLIELDAQGLDLEGITDEMVDNMRMRFAVDVYEEFVCSLRV